VAVTPQQSDELQRLSEELRRAREDAQEAHDVVIGAALAARRGGRGPTPAEVDAAVGAHRRVTLILVAMHEFVETLRQQR
jgi:hypothetical protein